MAAKQYTAMQNQKVVTYSSEQLIPYLFLYQYIRSAIADNKKDKTR